MHKAFLQAATFLLALRSPEQQQLGALVQAARTTSEDLQFWNFVLRVCSYSLGVLECILRCSVCHVFQAPLYQTARTRTLGGILLFLMAGLLEQVYSG